VFRVLSPVAAPIDVPEYGTVRGTVIACLYGDVGDAVPASGAGGTIIVSGTNRGDVIGGTGNDTINHPRTGGAREHTVAWAKGRAWLIATAGGEPDESRRYRVGWVFS
jgi:hypothetical protein